MFSTFIKRISSALVATGCALQLSTPAYANDLAQVVDANEQVIPLGTEATLDAGHADLGVLMLNDAPHLLVRDDSATTPVWRYLDDVVFSLDDTAVQQLPAEDSTYDFIGAQSGSAVWVIPQTEAVGVPWLGWNTQAPSLIAAGPRGMNFEFLGHQGEGDFSLFLQNGGFGAPDVLWSTATDTTDAVWVELNAHTHANWVFTQPGTQLIKVRFADDATDISAEGVLRFAINVTPEEARQVTWQDTEDAATNAPALWWVLGAVVLIVLVVVVVVLRRKR